MKEEVMPGFVHAVKVSSGAGAKLFLNERHSDVSIVVASDAHEMRYPAHSLLLSCMSEVMKRMLEMDMKEKSTKKIVVKDTNPETIKYFLRFIYTGEVSAFDWHEVVDLLAVAHKYQVDALTTICEKRLIQSLNLSRACFFHEISLLYSLPKLEKETMRLIQSTGFIILATNGFETVSGKTVKEVLSSRFLNVENELSVLSALKQWGKAECSRRALPITEKNVVDVMAPYFQYIRFHSIPRRQRQLIPEAAAERFGEGLDRVKYFVPPLLSGYMSSLKFVVELGSFLNKQMANDHFLCVRFSADASLYILGFRIVGMCKSSFVFEAGSPLLALAKDDDACKSAQFDLSTVPWKSGATVGDYTWREVVAYFPHPVRVEPFSCHTLTLKYGSLVPVKWPKTRMETNCLTTEFGAINVYSFGQCAGITELLIFPAPPVVRSCNEL